MRRYDDPVEVRQGWIGAPESGVEGPEQFLWRGRLWQVRAVVAHWVETGPWWQSAGVRALLGSDEREPEPPAAEGSAPRPLLGQDLLVERELWRVEAGRGRPTPSDLLPSSPLPRAGPGSSTCPSTGPTGSWQLVGCAD